MGEKKAGEGGSSLGALLFLFILLMTFYLSQNIFQKEELFKKKDTYFSNIMQHSYIAYRIHIFLSTRQKKRKYKSRLSFLPF